MTTIANGGKLVQPRIVKTIIDEKGKTLGDLKPTVVQAGDFTGDRSADRDRVARRRERARHGGRGGGARFHHLRQNRHRAKSCSEGGYEKDKYVVSFAAFCPPSIRPSSDSSCSTMRTPRTRS